MSDERIDVCGTSERTCLLIRLSTCFSVSGRGRSRQLIQFLDHTDNVRIVATKQDASRIRKEVQSCSRIQNRDESGHCTYLQSEDDVILVNPHRHPAVLLFPGGADDQEGLQTGHNRSACSRATKSCFALSFQSRSRLTRRKDKSRRRHAKNYIP